MAKKRSDPKKATEAWRNAKALLSRAIVFIRSKETTSGASGTTLQSSIAEAIADLDSSSGDPVDSLGDSSTEVENVDPAFGSGLGKGKLQKVEDLIALYYGDDDTEGLFEQLRKLPDPE